MSVTTFFESVCKGIVNDAKKIEAAFKKVVGDMPTIEADAAKIEPVIAGITAIVAPQASAVEAAIFAGGGLIMDAIDKLGVAEVAKFLNLPQDAAVLADIKAVIPTVKTVAAQKGVLPAAPAAA